ncbi:uncharacterized protein LOC133175903 [Saccostrea echinata]|uniref:uncharacterized protein LOC133175903 n=1 Tax=Saccostrea echinata TaxID=191078 RepID=UPI002A80E1B0|nr:uncharacterized protein LOC133175903 [Saccostrea echinata]
MKFTLSPVPPNIKDLHNIDLKKWEEEDTFYQETHSFPSMMEKVKDQPYVIFVGVPGSGKSATARHIALKLKSENCEVLPIKDIRKIEDYCDPHNPQVFVIEDAMGVYGLQQSEFNLILRYKEKIINPTCKDSKILMTCRDIVFNEISCHNFFLAKESNVIKLCYSEHALNEHDKKQILQGYGLDEDLLTPSELTSVSPMFPLLCKLFSKDLKFRSQGAKFFMRPVQCIIEELDEMKFLNKLNYATLILCMMNGDVLSKEILKDKNNVQFIDMKSEVLESCRVESHTDTFKFMDALSAMEGTYTKQCGAQYSFIHDYLYEICAFHYGQQFLDKILLYMDSCYIANYVIPKNVEATTSTTGEKSFDLCLRLNEDQYPLLSERLYRDIQELELYDVFMNDSLKHPQVIQAFIAVLERKSYTELKSLFLQKQEGGLPYLLSQVRDLIKETRTQTNEETERERQCVLIDEKWHSRTCMHNIRVISWVIMYGHYQILEYILKEIKKNDDDIKREVFMDTQNSEHPQSESEVFHDKIINEITESSNATKLLLNCRYIEQTRLLVLACYSGDVETVKAILPHMNRDSLNSICLSNAHTPLVIGCQSGFASIVEELVNAGADASQQDLHGNTPLVTACEGGHLSVMEKLVNVGVDVNQPDGRGKRPLVAACQGGHLSLVQRLVKLKADVNLRNGDGHPSLVSSVYQYHVEEKTTGKKGQHK